MRKPSATYPASLVFVGGQICALDTFLRISLHTKKRELHGMDYFKIQTLCAVVIKNSLLLLLSLCGEVIIFFFVCETRTKINIQHTASGAVKYREVCFFFDCAVFRALCEHIKMIKLTCIGELLSSLPWINSIEIKCVYSFFCDI